MGDRGREAGDAPGRGSVERSEDDPERESTQSSERGPDRGASPADGSTLAGADDPLVVLSLATFHTALLVAALVTGLYLAGPIGELLDGLQTSLGLGFYLALWASTWWTNRRWLTVVAETEAEDSASVSAVVGTGGKWGGVNGVSFFWVLFAVVVLPAFGFELDAALFFAVAFGIGTLLALGIGGIVGALFAAVDVALFRVADRFVPQPGEAE